MSNNNVIVLKKPEPVKISNDETGEAPLYLEPGEVVPLSEHPSKEEIIAALESGQLVISC